MRISSMRLGLICSVAVFLTACAGAPKDISLIPTQTGDITAMEGVFTQPLKVDVTKPNCKGTCPKVQVDSLIFPGNKVLTQYVDQQLAQMATFDARKSADMTVQQYIDYFWIQAGDKDHLILAAKPRYRNQNLTVLELGAWQYLTGAAHGMSEIRLINWDNKTNQPIAFQQIVRANQRNAFEQRLREAHRKWLSTQEAVLENPEEYNRLWPFQMTDNIGLTDIGVVAKYNSYEIAPYSSGQPELVIPYPLLEGIIDPKFMPKL